MRNLILLIYFLLTFTALGVPKEDEEFDDLDIDILEEDYILEDFIKQDEVKNAIIEPSFKDGIYFNITSNNIDKFLIENIKTPLPVFFLFFSVPSSISDAYQQELIDFYNEYRNTLNFFILQVDGISDKELVDEFRVDELPTIRAFHGFPEAYFNLSDVYVVKKGLENVVKLLTESTLRQFGNEYQVKKIIDIDHDRPFVLGFSFNEDSNNFNLAFSSAADMTSIELLEFYLVPYEISVKTAPSSCKKKDCVVIFQPKKYHSPYDKPSAIFTKFNLNSANRTEIFKIGRKMSEFVLKNRFPLVVELRFSDTPSIQKYLKWKPWFVAFLDIDWGSKETEYIYKKISSIAVDFKDKMRFFVADREKSKNLMTSLGLNRRELEEVLVGIVSIHNVHTGGRFGMKDEFDPEDLTLAKRFIKRYFEGSLTPFIKSESIPTESENSGSIKKIVGTNFRKVVNDPNYDVLVIFTSEAEKCESCHELKNVFQKLGNMLKDQENIKIVSIDAIANDWDIPEYDVTYLPTLYLAKAENKNLPVIFPNEISLDNIIQFLQDESLPLLIPDHEEEIFEPELPRGSGIKFDKDKGTAKVRVEEL